MPDYKFGDLICYKGYKDKHDAPLMYAGPCGHREGRNSRGESWGLIDILDLTGKYVDEMEHKDPSAWQLCMHYEAAEEWPTLPF
jgi:hypothetical protein